MTRVLIADADVVCRVGLTALIKDHADIEIVGETDTSANLIELVRDKSADYLILDITMTGRESVRVMRRLREHAPTCRTVVLTMNDDPIYVDALLSAGAVGYITKNTDGNSVLNAVVRAVRGEQVVEVFADPQSLAISRRGVETASRAAELARLSDREREVLRGLAAGRTYQEVAAELGISVNSVGTYRARITEKLGLQGRAELLTFALDTGLLHGGKPTN